MNNNFKKIAVIGAGVMGRDIALTLACYNYKILLKDRYIKILKNARVHMKDDFRFYKMMRKDFGSFDFKKIVKNITFTKTYNDFDKVDLVIENIPEDWELKQNLYKELQKKCSKKVIYATNTSCISITKIASLLPRPEKVIGMHFMNPVPLNDMVEIIQGHFTSDNTIEDTRKFVKSIRKIPVVVKDFPGFVSNRLSHLFMNEAAFLVQDNIANAKQIDLIFKKGYGHKMGPLETADLIGLDTVVKSLDVLYESYHDSKFRCCPLLRKMVDAGLLGKKSGKGFYEYQI